MNTIDFLDFLDPAPEKRGQEERKRKEEDWGSEKDAQDERDLRGGGMGRIRGGEPEPNRE
jgi:hypothetical protein